MYILTWQNTNFKINLHNKACVLFVRLTPLFIIIYKMFLVVWSSHSHLLGTYLDFPEKPSQKKFLEVVQNSGLPVLSCCYKHKTKLFSALTKKCDTQPTK